MKTVNYLSEIWKSHRKQTVLHIKFQSLIFFFFYSRLGFALYFGMVLHTVKNKLKMSFILMCSLFPTVSGDRQGTFL